MKVKTYTVQVPRGVAPCQVDDFPAKVGEGDDERDFHRSRKGSLRVTPGDLAVTEDELKHLRKHHKGLARRLVVVGERKERASKASPSPKAAGGRRSKGATAKAKAAPPEPEPEAPKARAPKAKAK